MDANVLIQMIGSLGFPICACVFMAIYVKGNNDNYRSDLKEMSQNHRTEMDKITEAINNNTLVIQKLIDKIEKDGD